MLIVPRTLFPLMPQKNPVPELRPSPISKDQVQVQVPVNLNVQVSLAAPRTPARPSVYFQKGSTETPQPNE
ncbi:hypothetical protein WAI453_013485 [Rhynchosporium graminicola]